MKLAAIPDSPTNLDLARAITGAHECIHGIGERQAKDHRAVLRLVAASEKRLAALEQRVEDNRTETQRTFKTNAEGFAIWMQGEIERNRLANERGEQLTLLIKALGVDKVKPRATLLAMTQSKALMSLLTVMFAAVLAIPLIAKIGNAVWGAVFGSLIPALGAVLLK